MTDTTSYGPAILDGMCRMLAAAGIGFYQGPDVAIPSGEVGIVPSALPSSPQRAISVTRYLDVPGDIAQNTTRVQVRSRVSQNPFDAEAVCDQIRSTFHGKTHVQLGDYRFDRIRLFSHGPLGPDQNGFYEFSQNFDLHGNRY